MAMTDQDQIQQLTAQLAEVTQANWNFVAQLAAAREALLEDKAMVQIYAKFFDAWVVCESTRGRYSCTPEHDCRCPKDHGITDKCECGWDELSALENQILAARKASTKEEA